MPITSPWPFAKWGVDIVGPMPPSKGNRKFLVVDVNYLTKWAETEKFIQIRPDLQSFIAGRFWHSKRPN
jgi:hypothetical protein